MNAQAAYATGLRAHTRAASLPANRQAAESSMDRLANAVIAREVAKDADQGQRYRDAQAAKESA